MSKIAVLIPSFKPGSHTVECLRSIEKQSLNNSFFCVYIALNGPRYPYYDFLFDLLKGFSFNYKVVYIEESGVSNARNLLLDISRESYVTFLDDDDCISECYLEDLLRIASPDYLAVSNVKCYENDIGLAVPNYIGRFFLSMEDLVGSKFRARKFFSSSCAKLMHRDLIGSYRFDKNVINGEDSLFMAQLSANVKGVKKAGDNAVYYVYSRPGSASRKKPKIKDEIFRILYLTGKYAGLLFDSRYEKLFILSRIAATLAHIKRIF